MTRTRLVVLAVMTIGLGTWMALRSNRTVNAAEAPTVAMYGENTQEVALDRWAHGAPRHWRSLMVKR